jgi:hypothetical protein
MSPDEIAGALHEAERLRGFDRRNYWHGHGLRIVSGMLNTSGFETYEHGIEFSDELKARVQLQDDRCSIMLRFRPDIAAVSAGNRSVLCEVKCPPPKDRWPDMFSLEARALLALQEWNAGGNVAMIAYVLLNPCVGARVGAAWLTDLPDIGCIRVPRRDDWERQLKAMGTLFPDRKSVVVKHSTGSSGTPYVMVPRSIFRRFDCFVDDLLAPRNGLTGRAARGRM